MNSLAARALERSWVVCGLVALCLGIPACDTGAPDVPPPDAHAGVLDLRDWNFQKHGSVPLRGEWQFVFGSFVQPARFDSDTNAVIVRLPAAWRTYTIGGRRLPTEGYASYRLRILMRPGLRLALLAGSVSVAGRVYVNGNEVERIGIAGTTHDSTFPDRRAKVISLASRDTVEVVLHVANFHYWKGGILQAPRLGLLEDITSSEARSGAYDLSLMLGMLLFTLTMVAFWLAKRADQVWLSFAMLCASSIVRVASTGERVVYQILPWITWEWVVRLELGSFYMLYYTLYRATYYLFPTEAKRSVLIGARSIMILTVGATLVTSARFHSMIVPGMQIMSVIGVLYVLYASLLALYRRRPGSVLYFIIFLLSAFFLFAEVLFHSNVLPFMLPTISTQLLLVQAMIFLLARRYGQAFRRIESFADELEHKVVERTHELRAAQDTIVHQEKMAALGQLTAGIAHEIKNPLNFVNNFAAVSREILDDIPEDVRGREDVAPVLDDLRDNLLRIHEHGTRADAIVRSMMLHARGGSGERRSVDIRALLDETADLAWHGARARMPDFDVTITRLYAPNVPHVTVSPQDISRVFMNLIGNAIDAVRSRAQQGQDGYTPRITLTLDVVDTWVEVRITDNGSGVPDTLRDRIFTPFFTTKPTGEGTGLGLSISHDIIVKGHGGSLFLDPSRDHTEFVVRLSL